MKCRFCGGELFDEHEMYLGGHEGCIEEMQYEDEENQF